MIERLAAFAAVDRLHALAVGSDLPDRAVGSALSVDISGFSALSEELARRLGPRAGAEELTRHLNVVYEALVSEIHCQGGSVVGFAGDGFTAWFDEARGRPASHAVACGLAIQGRFAAETTGEAVRSALALRVAVTSGKVRRLAVGDPAAHRLDVMAGETMTRLAAADALARAGEVVIDEATARGSGARIESGETRADGRGRGYLVVRSLPAPVEPVPWPPLPGRLQAEDLRPWHLPPLWEGLRAGKADFLTELRPAAALFLGFEGIEYDADPSAGDRLDAFVRRVQAVLARYEGTLVQLTIGDKGSYLYAAFGAPVAHDDDAFRSVRAAVRLARTVAEPPVRALRIGVSHGTMRVGAYGSTARRTYGVLGDEVNLAARLMQKAKPGRPLFSERIRHATRDVVRWKALPAVHVKGREEAVPVFEVLGARRSAPSAPSAIVGREDERTAIVWSLETLASGKGGVLVFEGEAGWGKSRLVGELVREAEVRRVRVAAGAGDALERSRPYHAWRAVLPTLLGLAEPAGARGRRTTSRTIGLAGTPQTRLRFGESRQREPLPEADARRLRALVSEAAPDLEAVTPLLNTVLPREMPETDWTRSMDAPVRAASTLDLVAALVQHVAARSPLVVVLEDGQWLDSASFSLAARVAGAQGLLLVIATRPFGETAPPEYPGLCESSLATVVRLGPLPPEAVAVVAAQALGSERLARTLAQLLQERAEGSPLVAIELARSLREAGAVEIDQGEARLSRGADHEEPMLPDGVEGIVLGRVDRLPPMARRIVKVASVIGREFPHSRLRQAMETVEGSTLEERAMAPGLLALEKAGLVESRAGVGEPAWAFASGVVQQVVYNLMSSDQRRTLHHAVAESYEAEETDDPGVLAHHWLRAGRALRARPHLERAAEAALRGGAWAEAGRLYGQLLETERGLEANEDRRRRGAGWQTRLAVAEAGAGRVGEARRHARAALGLLGQRTGGSLGGAVLASGARDFVLRRRAPASTRQAMLVEAAQVYERLAELHYLSDEPMAGLREALRGLALALRTGQTDVRARLQSAIALAVGVVPLRALSKPLMRGALEAARGVDDPATVGLVLEFAALHAFALGRWSEARAHIHEALARYETLGDRHRTLELRSTLAAVAYTRGQFAAAGALFADLAHDAAAAGNTRARSWAELGHALVAFRTGDTARGLALMGSRRAATLQPLARLHLGEPRDALEALPAALAVARGRPIKCWTLERFALPAEVALALREAELDLTAAERSHLVRLEREALGAARRFARVFPIGAPREARLRGLSHWLDGRRGRARRAWDEALTAAQRLGMPWDEARVRLDIGRHGATGSEEQADHLDRAATLLEELGAFDDRDDDRRVPGRP
ncbi:MAG: AAA family ATPase [Acidobacteria bacterium]|nr:AAA family ATPase [Acidobacteriota bacterium]